MTRMSLERAQIRIASQILVCLVALAWAAGPATADTVVFKAARDGYTSSSGSGYGYGDALYVSNYSSANTSWVGFQTSSLAVSSVDSITLQLIFQGGSTGDCSVNIYEITEDWGDWSEATLEAGIPPSAGSTPIAPAVNVRGNAVWDLPTDIWQSGKNLGFGFATSDASSYRQYITVEYPHDTDDSLAPQLEITYTDNGQEPIPEPGTLALLGVGLPALIAWKRRRQG
ncbi:MAG: PEP-CTERM sorting domain-containing protein [Armatimonadia bacterium]|nr:PEP-CTERM sorting domain-containing protein [Armatimonadia bacterium]